MAVAYQDYSTPPAGQTVSKIAWDFGDGNTGTYAGGQHLYAKTGTYNVLEMVTYSDGTTATQAYVITVGIVPQILVDGRSILYHLDTNGYVDAVNWNFGDASIAGDGLASGRHPYAEPGSRTITGSVTYKAPYADRIDPFGPVTVVVP